MSHLKLYGWKDLSGPNKPSYALTLRQATGDEKDKIVRYGGMLMTANKAEFLKRLNHDDGAIIDALTLSPATPPPTPPKPFEIMALPWDIRAQILKYIALDFLARTSPSLRVRVFLPGRGYKPPTPINLPPITRAGDRELRLQAILITIKLVTFEIHSGPGNAKITEWLSSLNLQGSGQTNLKTGFDAVHSLFFPYFSRYPFVSLGPAAPNNDIELMRRCANLRKVKVMFVPGTLVNMNGDQLSVNRLRQDYRLDRMLGLQNLRFLGLQCAGATEDQGSVLHALKAWFDQEFKELAEQKLQEETEEAVRKGKKATKVTLQATNVVVEEPYV